MRKSLLLSALIALILCGAVIDGNAASLGSGFGSFSDASTIGMGHANMLGGVGLTDDATTVFGVFTYGLSAHTDGRLKFGLIDHDYSDTEIMLGGDFKYQFISRDSLGNGPFDMAFGAFFEYYNFPSSAWMLGAQYIGSYPILMKNNHAITPYGRFNVRLENISDNSNLEVGVNAGIRWEMTRQINFYGEFQFDGNDGIFFGLDFNLM